MEDKIKGIALLLFGILLSCAQDAAVVDVDSEIFETDAQQSASGHICLLYTSMPQGKVFRFCAANWPNSRQVCYNKP